MFSNIVTSKVHHVQLQQAAHLHYFLQVKMKNFAHSRIFKDRNPNSMACQGLEFSFPNSRTFQDF